MHALINAVSTTCLLSEFLTYATTVEWAFDFLINDTGEDRWLCTLMVRVVDGGGGHLCTLMLRIPKRGWGKGVLVALYSHGVCSRGGCLSPHVIM